MFDSYIQFPILHKVSMTFLCIPAKNVGALPRPPSWQLFARGHTQRKPFLPRQNHIGCLGDVPDPLFICADHSGRSKGPEASVCRFSNPADAAPGGSKNFLIGTQHIKIGPGTISRGRLCISLFRFKVWRQCPTSAAVPPPVPIRRCAPTAAGGQRRICTAQSIAADSSTPCRLSCGRGCRPESAGCS